MVALADHAVLTSRKSLVVRGPLESSELADFVESRTFRQVADLLVVQDANRILLLGRSKSYYVKQLATHAVLEFSPEAQVENAIDVA